VYDATALFGMLVVDSSSVTAGAAPAILPDRARKSRLVTRCSILESPICPPNNQLMNEGIVQYISRLFNLYANGSNCGDLARCSRCIQPLPAQSLQRPALHAVPVLHCDCFRIDCWVARDPGHSPLTGAEHTLIIRRKAATTFPR
jgi:hypothetical protein